LYLEKSRISCAPCNLLTDGIAAALKPLGFDENLPTAFIFEGCSMYFRADENTRILGQLRELLLGNAKSKIWLDIVAEELLGQNVDAGVETFMRGMARIGEPFVFGLPLESNFFSDLGLRIESLKDATPYAQNLGTSLFECYRFYSLSCMSSHDN
jgi:O-methyltransferase involved in polyketide biosynthesis